ncbi:MAG: hypothetical protein WC744_03285 [Patescibacteria group bacterium]|jgi:hypothetical protein
MNKTTVIVLLITLILLVGFLIYKNNGQKNLANSKITNNAFISQPTISLSPIFSNLSLWVPNATWTSPKQTVEDTTFGKLKGTKIEGEMKGADKSIKRNYENPDVMKSLGFTEDMSFAADGPGASNWGYSKTENGKMQVVIFGYSSNRLLGPDSKAEPFVNLSVFVSDPFVKQ